MQKGRCIMSGYTNTFKRHSQRKKVEKSIQFLPKSDSYREALVPFMGACITVACSDFQVKSGYTGTTPSKIISLENPQIVKVPTRMRSLKFPTVSHLWVVVDNHLAIPTENTKLTLRGFLYEYASKGHKNIGLKVVGIRITKKENI